MSAIMTTIHRLSIVAACFAGVCVALLYAQGQPTRSEADKDCTYWVQTCLRDFESIKVGMTRDEIKGKFPLDGGVQSVSPVRFTHPACAYFKIDVEFDFKRNAADQNRAIWGKEDKVTKVSKPYIERPFID
jgi:hypothetical protein